MIVVTGGAYQGKLEFARSICRKKEPMIAEGETASDKELEQADIVAHFHLYIKRQMEHGCKEQERLEQQVQELLLKNPNVILEINQLGCGIVPMDALERSYRELTGRISCKLAEQAEEVYLVHCGIARKLKE